MACPTLLQGFGIDIERQQCLDVLNRGCSGQFLKNVAQVTVRLMAVGLGGEDETVEAGRGFGPSDSIGEEPVVAISGVRS